MDSIGPARKWTWLPARALWWINGTSESPLESPGPDKKAKRAARFSACTRIALVMGFFVSVFPPLAPRPCDVELESKLDGSWRIAINYARVAGLNYGTDIAFTYGPLGFVACPMDVGNNLAISVVFRLLIYVVGVGAVCACAWRCQRMSTFATVILVAALSGCWQDVEKSVIVATIACLSLAWSYHSRFLIGLAAFISAFATLLKFSSGAACMATLLVWAISAFLFRPRREALASMLAAGGVFLITLVSLFRAFGGPVSGLWPWFERSWWLSSGYSQMMVPGPQWELALALFEISLLTWAAISARSNRPCIFAFLLILPAVFFNFKHGFVRHDGHHAPFFFICMPLLACFLLPDARKSRRIALTTTCVALLMMSITHRLFYLSGPAEVLGSAYWNLRASEQWAQNKNMEDWSRQAPWQILPRGCGNLRACIHWEAYRGALNTTWAEQSSRQSLPPEIRDRIGGDSVDAYPWDVYLPVMSDLNWRPRPILQSYSAYSPALDNLGASYYSSDNGPRFILYRHQAIDAQHPLIVDPATWIEMFRWYDVDQRCDPETLLLIRRAKPRYEPLTAMGSMTLRFGERWEVPAVESLDEVVLHADLRLTPYGRFREAAFRIQPPSIRIEYQDGSTRIFRLVWRNLEAGFVVSDLPVDMKQVAGMWRGERGAPVRAITFMFQHPWRFDKSFEPRMDIRWSLLRRTKG